MSPLAVPRKRQCGALVEWSLVNRVDRGDSNRGLVSGAVGQVRTDGGPATPGAVITTLTTCRWLEQLNKQAAGSPCF